MKKLLTILSCLFLLTPLSAFASVAVGWNASSTDKGFTSPNAINSNFPSVLIGATTSTATNVIKLNGSSTSTISNGLNITGGGLTVGALSGFLKATAGVLQTALISLTADVSGTLPIANGGTATTTYYTKGVNFFDGTRITQAAGSGASILNWDNTNGYLGIGTTTPYAPLSITGSGTTAPYLIVSGPQPLLQVGSSSPGYGDLPNDRFNTLDNRNDYSAINAYNLSAGNCATADLTAANDLNSSAANFIDIGHTSSGFTGVGCANNPFTGFGANAGYIFDPNDDLILAVGGGANNKIRLFTGGYDQTKERVTIDNTGALGIGSTTPHAVLSINAGSTTPTKNLIEASYSTGTTNNATTTVFSIATSTGTAVNIATSSAIGSNVLTVNGGVYFHGLATGAGNGALCATTDGLVSYDAGANCIVSSERFKTDIQNLTVGTALTELAALKPVSFRYKQGNGDNGLQEHIGLIAEQVAKVDPRLVIYDKDNKPFSLHFEEFIPLFVQSIQDILTRMDSQQREIDTLKAQVKALQDAQQRPLPKQL